MFPRTINRIITRNVSTVRIVEVGPRDGLQNEAKILPTATKIDFINRLSKTGLKTIEATSFVSAKWIPQMGDNVEVMKGIDRVDGVTYSAIVPNMKGFQDALDTNTTEIAVGGSASEAFTKKNFNCSIAEGVDRVKSIMKAAKDNNLKVRGYVSTIIACPYEGKVKPSAVAKISEMLLDVGCYEISLGDTIGVGTPGSIKEMLKEVLKVAPVEKFAIHYHDTYGQALPNILTSLDFGISIVDASVSGLGGCPYARGASGNAATEDVVYMLEGCGVKTGIDLNLLIDTGKFICEELGRSSESKVNRATRKSQPK
ncbi:hydroxymethylglutaryl-CoA lyase, mitochondrial-like [Chironomus tepperi]|uniref:hydroxymethylglutaryl-CoA lyase, mitochondrial-like n=1 Tax=Chironomus tepperi TaxID=113505 RepID=UPI00391FA4DB